MKGGYTMKIEKKNQLYDPYNDEHWFCHNESCNSHFTLPRVDIDGIMQCPVCSGYQIDMEDKSEE